MLAPTHAFALSLLCLAVTACAPPLDAVVGGGTVTLQSPDAAGVVATGPISFDRRTTLTAGPDGARVRVQCGGTVSEHATTDGAPGAGMIDFDLAGGARLRRRNDTAFDLVEGAASVRTGAAFARLIVLHGTCYLSAEREGNADGIDVRLTTHGAQLKAEVVKGAVLLNAADASEKHTIYIPLGAGETSVAMPGESPEKGTMQWYDSD